MKKIFNLFWLLTLMLFLGCSKSSNKLTISFSRNNQADSSNFRFSYFNIENQDSLIFENTKWPFYSVKDIITLDSLPSGEYSIHYTDIFNKPVTKQITLSGQNKQINIITDSINAVDYYADTPIERLKNNEYYIIDGKGGCIATIYASYTMHKFNNQYYIDTHTEKNRLLNQRAINAVRQFEAELLALEKYELCSSTGAFTYKIIKNGITLKTIKDKTCNWNGWQNMFYKLNKEL